MVNRIGFFRVWGHLEGGLIEGLGTWVLLVNRMTFFRVCGHLEGVTLGN